MPWTETILIDALSTIGVDPTKFITTACQALTEQDAIYFQRQAQVLARYHTTKAHLRSLPRVTRCENVAEAIANALQAPAYAYD